jgi:sulfite reductase (ferredoxin)
MKWLVDTSASTRCSAASSSHPQVPAWRRRRGPAASPPRSRRGRRPGRASRRRPTHRRRPGHVRSRLRRRPAGALRALGGRQRRARRRQGHGVGLRLRRLGDITADQFRALAAIQRELGAEVRLTNRQNLVFRDLTERPAPELYERLDAIGMAEPGAELARDVVACPGADTCNLAVTQSRGLAKAIGDRPRGGGPRRGRRRAHQHLGLHQLLRPAPRRRHRLLRRRAPGPRPVGPRLPDAARRLRRRGADPLRREGAAPAGQERPEARSGSSAASPASARPARLPAWLDRSGGAKAVAEGLKDLDHFPTPDDDPDFYVDYGETGPYVAEVGASECAT